MVHIRFKLVSVNSLDLEELRRYHSIDDIRITLVEGDIVAHASTIAKGYENHVRDTIEYIQHAINCAFFVKEGYESGTVL